VPLQRSNLFLCRENHESHAAAQPGDIITMTPRNLDQPELQFAGMARRSCRSRWGPRRGASCDQWQFEDQYFRRLVVDDGLTVSGRRPDRQNARNRGVWANLARPLTSRLTNSAIVDTIQPMLKPAISGFRFMATQSRDTTI